MGAGASIETPGGTPGVQPGETAESHHTSLLVASISQDKDVMKALAKLYNEDEASFKKGIEKFIQSVKEEAAKLKGADTEVAKGEQEAPVAKAQPSKGGDDGDAKRMKDENGDDILRQIVQEMNVARTKPQEYASFLKSRLQFYDESKKLRLPGHEIILQTQEGKKAVEECIAELEKASAVPAISTTLPAGMNSAAMDHVADTGPKNMTGHKGSDGSMCGERLNRHGTFLKCCGENISYGASSAKDIVAQLMVDDGVPSRGHRKNILKADFKVAGAAVGPHQRYGKMCVIVYAGGYRDGAPEFDKTKPASVCDATTMTEDLQKLLKAVPMEQIQEKIQGDFESHPGCKVSVTYTPPGSIEVTTKMPDGSSATMRAKWG